MASRDRFEWKIICPKCSNEGTLHVSENDYPFMKKLDRHIDSIEGNFKAEMRSDFDANVICGNCGEIFTR